MSVLQEWYDAVNCATERRIGSPADRWMRRVASAGDALARDYVKVVERADREARLAVALRLKLEEAAGPAVASSVFCNCYPWEGVHATDCPLAPKRAEADQ